MPRLQGVHHVGITVRDLDRSRAWYEQVLGLDKEASASSEGPVLSQAVGVEGASLRFCFFRAGNTRIELLEYGSPPGEDFRLRNCDVGASHICLQVDDIEATCARLRSLGVEFSSAPTPVEGGAFAGATFCYFRDPDGIQLELWAA